MNRTAAQVAEKIGKTENWVRRNASRYPHHRLGKTYFWTDEDVADILTASRVRPGLDQDGELRPIPSTRRRAS